MKQLVLFVCLLFCFLAKSQSSPEEITDRFFEKYKKDPMSAIDYIFSTSKYIDAKSENIVALKNKVKNVVDLCGDYLGFEYIDELKTGERIKMITYLVYYERQPMRFTFMLYKPKEKWVLQNFSFDTELDENMDKVLSEKMLQPKK